MDREEYKEINPDAKKLWMINGIIASVILMIICYVIFRYTNFWVFVLGIVISIYITFIHPPLEYKQWSYKITQDYIDYSYGICFKKRTIIPISRIQHMDIKQGPIQKNFALANIVIFTAGQSHIIEAILYSEAEEIVESINKLIMRDVENGDI